MSEKVTFYHTSRCTNPKIELDADFRVFCRSCELHIGKGWVISSRLEVGASALRNVQEYHVTRDLTEPATDATILP